MESNNIKILIVDDNEISTEFISDVVGMVPGADVADIASGGRMALAKLRRHAVDLVLLDIEMPEMDGLETLEIIREKYPHVDVVMISAEHEQDADKVVRALQAGAIDFVSKLDRISGTFNDLRLRLLTITGLVRSRRRVRIAKKMVETNTSPLIPAENFILKKRLFPLRTDAVAIAVSTGGPNALAEVIPNLPKKIGVPVLVVQHMPPFLASSLVNSLNEKSELLVKEAAEGEEVLPDAVYFASGGKHMTVRKEKRMPGTGEKACIRLNSGPPENSVRPSADVLFRSLSDVYSGSILAVIMTGMGGDGAEGVRILKKKHCYCLSQTADTCIVYGMPKTVDEAGLSDEKVPLGRLAKRITEILNKA